MRRIKVLVADDNADHLFLTTLALKSVKDVEVEVTGARDGQEAMDFLHGGAGDQDALPDLVLLDLSMPRRSGLQVLEDIKGDAALSRIPVIVLTSSDQPADVRSSYELGANCFVTKTGDLTEVVEYWLQTAKLPPV